MKNKKELNILLTILLCLILAFSFSACSEEKAPTATVVATVNGHEITSDELDDFTTIYMLFTLGYPVDQLPTDTLEKYKFETVANIMVDNALIMDYLKDDDVLNEEAKKQLEDKIIEIRNSSNPLAPELERLKIKDDTIRMFYEYMFYAERFIQKINTEIPVDNEDIENYYNENKTKFVSPASISLSQIQMGDASHKEADRASIQNVLDRISNGEDFSQLAKEFSIDPTSKEMGGALGIIYKGQLPPEIEPMAFNLKNGEVSEIVESDRGFHIIKATSDLIPEHQQTLEEASALILKTIQSENMAARLQELRKNAKIEYITAIDPNTIGGTEKK